MTYNVKFAAAVLLLPFAIAIAAPAFAEEASETGEAQVNETQALMNAKISIGDAIKSAEAESKGKAVDSGLNDENGAVSYQVEVLMPDGKRMDVFVDLQTGKVLKMADAGAGDDEPAGENGENHESGEQGENNAEGNN